MAGPDPIVLRDLAIGDIGWIVHRQSRLYAEAYGWDASFEALLAEIGAAFLRGQDPAGERAWIAEMRGVIVGSVLLVRESATVAKLRLLYVEPAARGQGLGRRLTRACIAFARTAGYTTLTLSTYANLTAARAIYRSEGFLLGARVARHAFGHALTSEAWALALDR